MATGTGIANIWAREPQTMHAAAAMLAQAYPDRPVLGLGVGFAAQAAATGREFGSPLATMRDYLRRMDDQTLAPKMLALAGEAADGVMPAGLPPEFTAHARQALGPEKLVVIGLTVIPDTDGERAKEAARQTVSGYLGRPSYAATMAGLAFSEAELAGVGGRVVDAVVGHGGPDVIAAKVGEHLAAGADHVALMLPSGTEFETGTTQLERLAPALVRFAASTDRSS